jgi:hypothetical protein
MNTDPLQQKYHQIRESNEDEIGDEEMENIVAGIKGILEYEKQLEEDKRDQYFISLVDNVVDEATYEAAMEVVAIRDSLEQRIEHALSHDRKYEWSEEEIAIAQKRVADEIRRPRCLFSKV